ncbi:hypothetical protein RUM44_012636 [Polyplax serrata]|uniref:Odorant receptor n=1 Tax=Polyplax serrata TaxID=468196 RepID=A0ABR1BBV5_POLSC
MFKTYKEVFGVTHVLLRVSGFLNFGRKHTLFRTFHQIYQSIAYLTFLLFTLGTILQLFVIREDSHLVYTSLSATLGTGGIFVKTTLLMRKRIRIGALQKQINETLVAGEDAEEPGVRQFYEKAVKEMKHMYTMVYVMTAVLITMWIVSGVVASLSDVPKTVPLPNWVPWDVDYLPLYIFTVFYQGHGAYFVGLTGVSINLTIFGSVIQLCSEFDVLTKNILDVKKWCENAIENGSEKFRVLDAKENLAVERMLLKNVRHHQRII